MASGGIYKWADPGDDRDIPDTFSAVYEYPDKFHIPIRSYFGNEHYGYGEQFMGDEGTIEVNSRQHLYFYPEQYKNRAKTPELIPPQVKARKELTIDKPSNDNLAVQSHMRNFVASAMGKEQPIAPIAVGQQAAIGGHMATLSFKAGKKILWDDELRRIVSSIRCAY